VTGPPYTGHCLCGGVRFEVTEEPLSAGYCHCTRCQRRTGTAASAQARLAPGSFRFLAGEELVHEYAPGASGKSAAAEATPATSEQRRPFIPCTLRRERLDQVVLEGRSH